jgi:hypothetical protein
MRHEDKNRLMLSITRPPTREQIRDGNPVRYAE